MRGQTAVVGVIWSDDANQVTAALDASLRLVVCGGTGAVSRSASSARAALTVVSMPSNHHSGPPARPVGCGEVDGLLVVADAWLVDSADPSDAAQHIGELYRSHGEDGLDRLDGDFSFVIYDTRSDTVIMRRDPFGVRPLFWARIPGGGVAFASLPEVIVRAGLLPAKRNVGGVLDLLARSSGDRPETLISGLNRVPPRTQITLREHQTNPDSRQYWSPAPQSNAAPDSFSGWTSELRRLLDTAVRSRLPSTGDLAVSITSGLDSTSVAVLAERHMSDDQRMFASTYAASEEAEADYPGMLDETAIASNVVEHLDKISWERVRRESGPNPASPPLAVTTFATENSRIPEFVTAPRAVEHGADVLLTGWGGDNAVTYKGYGVAAALLRNRKWSALKLLGDHYGRDGRASWRFYAKTVRDAMINPGNPLHTLLENRHSPNLSHRLMSGLLAEHRERQGPLNEFRKSDTLSNRLNEVGSPVLTLRLEVLACHGLRSGIRYVHPLLDRALTEFALTCPPEFEFRDGLFRSPIRAAMQGVLPDSARLHDQSGYPFVEATLDIARQKQDLLKKFDAFESDARLHKYFDFPLIREHLELLPSVAVAEEHVRDVSTSGRKKASPANFSTAALISMEAVKTALDEEESGSVAYFEE